MTPNTTISTSKSEPPVITLHSGEKLSKSKFIKYFEDKVAKTIRTFKLLDKKEHLGVAVSGGKDSLTVLTVLHKITKKNPNITLSALTIDEGIKNYRDKSIEDAKKVCKELGVPLHIFSYKEAFGHTLDEILTILDVKPCTVCGVFRRFLINTKSRELGFTKLATGHNLDDEAQSILMNQFRNTVKESARLGPKTGITTDPRFIPRIKPLYQVTEKEVATYAFIGNLLTEFNECPNVPQAQRATVRDLINQMESTYPGSKHGLVGAFLQTLPALKQTFASGNLTINACEKCGEPASGKVCKACYFLEKIRTKSNKKM